MTAQEERQAELRRKVEVAAAQVKQVCGVGNNAAWAVCLEAMDHLKQHPRFRHTVKQRFKEAMEAFKQYESALIYPGRGVRYFDIDDMPPSVRKKYGGDISDRDYYELWAGVGCAAYKQTRPMVTSLQNKFRLSLQKHGVAQPDIIGWAMAAETCLALATVMYGGVMADIEEQMPTYITTLRTIFSPFSIEHIHSLWQRALIAICPEADGYALEDGERRNIELGVEQLQDAWDNIDTIYSSTAKAVTQFDDIFRTPGEMKKALREIAEQQASANAANRK